MIYALLFWPLVAWYSLRLRIRETSILARRHAEEAVKRPCSWAMRNAIEGR